jgi:transcriptional regulator with XRE-family HTH domain
MSEDEEVDQNFEGEGSFGKWLRSEMAKQDTSIQDLADKTGLTYVGIWNIVRGNTKWPREATREKISRALNSQVPSEVETEITNQSSVSGYIWTDFSPYDLQTIPELGGIYVFYDITDRPVYVGNSTDRGAQVRRKVLDRRN